VIDSHCHLADEAFENDLETVTARARDAGVRGALCVLDATKSDEAIRATRVVAAWPAVRFAVGVHPHQAGVFTDRLDDVTTHLRAAIDARSGTVAVGEIGLDYHYDFAPREVQREVFRRQIRVAVESGRPIVIHTREADNDTIALLTEEGAATVTGVVHCFTGDAAMATRIVGLGLHVSFSGIVTFKAAESVRAAAAVVPTDCSWKQTLRIWRRFLLGAGATSRPGSGVSPKRWLRFVAAPQKMSADGRTRLMKRSSARSLRKWLFR
jgi:TatD DNase family protein